MSEPWVQEIDRREFLRRVDPLLATYAAAMSPPAEQLPGRRIIMQRHSEHPRFRALVAERGRRPAGFCYGFQGLPGQWWHDIVRDALVGVGGEEHAHHWLGDSFEIAELHVRPDSQHRGLGRRLVTSLCEGRAERTAVLSTLDLDSPARALYRSLNMTELLVDFRFPGGGPPYAIMGATLPLTSSRE